MTRKPSSSLSTTTTSLVVVRSSSSTFTVSSSMLWVSLWIVLLSLLSWDLQTTTAAATTAAHSSTSRLIFATTYPNSYNSRYRSIEQQGLMNNKKRNPSSNSWKDQLLQLRCGDVNRKNGGNKAIDKIKSLLPAIPRKERIVDTVLGGLGITLTYTILSMLEQRYQWTLIIGPMMASTLIFFSAQTPPNPKGFVLGTLGCGILGPPVNKYVTNRMGGSPTIAKGAISAVLYMWFKSTGCIFPPTAVIPLLMLGAMPAQKPWQYMFRTWFPGHVGIYVGAILTSYVRSTARYYISKPALSTLSTPELRTIFQQFDTSKDNALDPNELKCALRVTTGKDLPLKVCQSLVHRMDKDGNGVVDFHEFQAITRERL